MTDIVERLRKFGRLANPPLVLAMDAADEIERLRADLHLNAETDATPAAAAVVQLDRAREARKG